VNCSRRDLKFLLPALLVAPAGADVQILPSKSYPFDGMTAKTNAQNHMQTRSVFNGKTQTGCPIGLHISTLPPGEMPHPPHHHVNEEILMIKEGTVESTIAGHTSRVGPGSVIYINSNEEHGLKNVGDVPATYFVVEIGHQTT
jgi:mannose-6-phosphate isomerase-like protein (cupin superfamily)